MSGHRPVLPTPDGVLVVAVSAVLFVPNGVVKVSVAVLFVANGAVSIFQ
jgi:hypothetical protein